MLAFIALLVGYVIGAQAGSKDLDQVAASLKRLGQSEEFADAVSAVRIAPRAHAPGGGDDRRGAAAARCSTKAATSSTASATSSPANPQPHPPPPFWR